MNTTTIYKNLLSICFGLVAKTMLVAPQMRVIYLSGPDLEWCLVLGNLTFLTNGMYCWREWNSWWKKCQNNQHMKKIRITWWLPEICLVFQTFTKVLQNCLWLSYPRLYTVVAGNSSLGDTVMGCNVRFHLVCITHHTT